VLLADEAAEGHVVTNGAVVSALRTGVPELQKGVRVLVERARGGCGPAHRAAVLEQSVLLLDTEPGHLLWGLIEYGLGQGAGGLFDGS
jgi:hypothetical protein